jgi:hypothetical protein
VPASLASLPGAGFPKHVVVSERLSLLCILQLITPHDVLCGSSRGLRSAQNSERRTARATQTININIRIRSNICYDVVRTPHWFNSCSYHRSRRNFWDIIHVLIVYDNFFPHPFQLTHSHPTIFHSTLYRHKLQKTKHIFSGFSKVK